MRRYDAMRQWTNGFCAALLPEFIDESKGPHWLAGYNAGCGLRAEKNRLLDEYLVATGREPQAVLRLATAEKPLTDATPLP